MIILLIVAALLRLYGIHWDQGIHLHPDERMLIIVADRIHFFDKLNPHFFNYGTLPIYLLKGISQLIDAIFRTSYATYDGMLNVGRLLSVATDIGTLALVYLVALQLFKKRDVALYAAFTYTFTFFTIQNTHFFVVDVFLTFFVTATVYTVLLYLQKYQLKYLILIALSFGAALATKITAIVFLPVLLGIFFIPLFDKKNPSPIPSIVKHVLLFLVLTTITVLVCMPYMYISWHEFMTDVSTQTLMSRNPYIFPYTLQYVGTLPYLYFLKNMFLWGMGPIFSVIGLLGLYEFSKKINSPKAYFVSIFYLLYFIVVGVSAVKFMRYMLPLYPFFAVLVGLGFSKIRSLLAKPLFIFVVLLCIVWTGMFVNIYSYQHTRIAATNWIIRNIPAGSTLAIEHWEDRLPLTNSEQYQYAEMTLYDLPDNQAKWTVLHDKLATADYLILASNRLYVPLQKLSDCSKYKSCYPLTAEYYKKLFSGKLGFDKVYEAQIYPSFSIFGHTIGINDQKADESFTVYDHPKIMIFKKR